ncbi:MAG TPA: polyribonucleotide nucleotidyltransferase, partial [Aestuariivirga sp.]|nr:polyribonucleotide nucleotidyltransferase [Aestuariivirga sp.]
MFKIDVEELEWAGKPLRIETGRMARQADGAVLVTYGETTVLATAVAARSEKPGIDFFPLTVNYQEKTYAAGKIPGGYFKREGRPTEKETLVSRLIDRPIRPLFPEGFRNETQVIATVLSYDLENDSDIVSLIASSAALTLSGIPFMGPVGGARVGVIEGAFVLNPTQEQMKTSDLDLVVAGTTDAVLMVESEAKELSEEQMLGAVMFGHAGFQPVIDAIIRLAERSSREPREFAPPDHEKLYKAVKKSVEKDLRAAYAIPKKEERQEAVAKAKDKAVEALVDAEKENAPTPQQVAEAFKHLEKDIVRNNILDTGHRIDGRDTKTVRQIVAEASVLPRTHGSSLFTRGETQALVVTTLGTGEDEQYVDSLDGTYKSKFMLHYNFPPYSTGETGRVGSPKRREIGHGRLAKRALVAVLPSAEEFGYTMRVV